LKKKVLTKCHSEVSEIVDADIDRLNFELSWFERQQQLKSEHTDVVNKTRGIGTKGIGTEF
jgi:hypothetical protein